MSLHRIKIDSGLFLDEIHLKGVRAYKIKQNEGSNSACLTLEMDVVLFGNQVNSDFNGFLNEDGDRSNRD